MKLRCIVAMIVACLACWSTAWAQCWNALVPGNASPTCPKDLVQVHGWVPNGSGDLLTQIWEGNDAHPNSTNTSFNYQAIFDTTDVNGLPMHPNVPSTYRLWQMVGINYTAGSSTLNSEVQYDWPICQSPGCSGNGNVALGVEQAQQDGWLILPDAITCVRFQFSQQTAKSAAIYIGSDSTDMMAMDSVFAVHGANGSSGGNSPSWTIPTSVPRSDGGLGFRYVRIRIYHQNPVDDANSEVMWDVGNGFATIPRAYFQRVSHPDSADLRPMGMRPAACRFCYLDDAGNLFRRLPNQHTGAQVALDQRFKEGVAVVDTMVRSFDPCDTVANCGVFEVILIRRHKLLAGGRVFSQNWSDSANVSQYPSQQNYREAFPNLVGGLPKHLKSSNSSGQIAIDTLGYIMSNPPQFQGTHDAWLLVPARVRFLEFRLGDPAATQATALWIGDDIGNMTEVASEVNGLQRGGTYQVPASADTTPEGWRWLRMRFYVSEDGDNTHDSRVKWDLGQGMEYLIGDHIVRCLSANDNVRPGSNTYSVQLTSREYGLFLADGTAWRANGINPLNHQVSLRDSLVRYITVELIDDTLSQVTPTTGPGCVASYFADPCNLDPVAVRDTMTVVRGVNTFFNPLVNDYDPNTNNTLRVIAAYGSNWGVVDTAGPTQVQYEATNDTATIDSFLYDIQDNGSGIHTATATIVVIIQGDEDGDHVPDGVDEDNDNDGIADVSEDATARDSSDTDDDNLYDRLDLDADNDGIPDIVELGLDDPDTNGLVPLDTLRLLSADADTNGLDDGAANIIAPDTDSDGIPDFQDLDADDDGIPDIAERGFSARASQGTFTAILLDVDTTGWDARAKGLDRSDIDLDGALDRLDLDSDNDGIPNILEAGYPDHDGNGRLDAMDDSMLDGMNDTLLAVLTADQDRDSIPNYLDRDADNDGIPDIIEAWGLHVGMVDSFGCFANPLSNVPAGWQQSGRGSILFDFDHDGLPNFLDLDSDNDGLYDRVEETGNWATAIDFVTHPQDTSGWGWDIAWRGTNGTDQDGDGFPNRLDLDSDNDGISDLVEAGGIDSILVDGMMDELYDTIRNGADDFRMRTATLNHDGDALSDWLDLDSDNDGLLDFYEGRGGIRIPAGTVPVLVGVDTLGWTQQYRVSGTQNSDSDPLPDRIDLDADNDGIYDYAEGLPAVLLDSIDVDSNGKLDRLLGMTTFDTLFAKQLPEDTDLDAIPDHADLDSDNDGLADLYEDKPNASSNMGSFTGPAADSTGVYRGLTRAVRDDDDQDGIPDFRDLDSDQDGISDIIESGGEDLSGPAGTGDGRFDLSPNPLGWLDNPIEPDSDVDQDGLQAHLDLDSDNDGIPDIVEAASIYPKPFPTIVLASDTLTQGWDDIERVPHPLDWDDDGLYDFMDWDSDDDGIVDVVESKKSNLAADENMDGILDGFTSTKQGWDSRGTLNPVNTDDDVWPDYRDLDSDGDSLSDHSEFLFGFPVPDEDHDCDKNFTPNWQDDLPCDLLFYQGFSPDGDGINDEFVVDGIRYHRYDNTFTVFNRWGEVIYKLDGWDGRWNGVCNRGLTASQPADVGVYYYTFQFGENRERFQKGYIHLRR